MRKIINYPQFYNQLSPNRVFSRQEAEQAFPKFDSRRLFEWKQKGYLIKLTNKWYVFSNVAISDGLNYLISNAICQPSYISLETALYFHQLIVDSRSADSFGEKSIQAITKHKTVVYHNDRGVYSYRKIKPEFYFGFETLEIDGKPIQMANPEKALIDFLYFNANLNSLSKLTSIAWNIQALNQLDWKKLGSMQMSIGSKALDRRMDLLKKGFKMTDF
ncbi:MAG: type IV toxin-antitoxin system AbiEi family antitoxin domain-containing protein [Sediminibacterium sp.]